VAYGSVLQERRRALHGRIAAAIEARYPARLEQHVEQLAHHTLRAEAWDEAVPYLQRAGAKAASHSALREARGYYEQAIAALEHLPTTRALQIQAIDLRLALRNVLQPLMEITEIIERLQQAEAFALALDDQHRLGRVLIFQSTLLWQTGAARAGIEAGLRARAVAEALDDFGLQVAADWALGPAYFFADDFPEADRVLRRLIDALQGDDRYADFGLAYLPAVHARGILAGSLSNRGEFAEAHALGEEGLRIAEAADHPNSIAGVTFRRGVAYSLQGNLPMAIACFEQAIALSQQWQLLVWSASARSNLAYTYLLAGRVEEGLTLLPADPEGTRRLTLGLGTVVADSYRLAGRLAEAADRATRALTVSREQDGRGREALALRSLGDLATDGATPAVGEAERYYQEALALAAELGMRPLVAHCHLGLGTLYQKVGRHDEARAELTTAGEMYRAMEMPFWLEKAEAELGKTSSTP
jgi:tetratricopeptide (TPR) repeat protein